MIKKTPKGYAVYNKTGTKKLSKDYTTKKAAVQRLGEIEYFKKKNK